MCDHCKEVNTYECDDGQCVCFPGWVGTTCEENVSGRQMSIYIAFSVVTVLAYTFLCVYFTYTMTSRLSIEGPKYFSTVNFHAGIGLFVFAFVQAIRRVDYRGLGTYPYVLTGALNVYSIAGLTFGATVTIALYVIVILKYNLTGQTILKSVRLFGYIYASVFSALMIFIGSMMLIMGEDSFSLWWGLFIITTVLWSMVYFVLMVVVFWKSLRILYNAAKTNKEGEVAQFFRVFRRNGTVALVTVFCAVCLWPIDFYGYSFEVNILVDFIESILYFVIVICFSNIVSHRPKRKKQSLPSTGVRFTPRGLSNPSHASTSLSAESGQELDLHSDSLTTNNNSSKDTSKHSTFNHSNNENDIIDEKEIA